MLIFLDLETTGLEIEDKVCSIGLILQKENSFECFYELLNEGKKISPKASSINHITNEMLKGKPKLKDTKSFEILEKYNNKETTLIGHNIAFDIEKLTQIGFCFQGNIVDTCKVSKHLIEDSESYSLQFLRYELKLYRQEQKILSVCPVEQNMQAHNALCDAIIVKLLYEYLLELKAHDELCDLSIKNVLLQKFTFGKHKGKFIEEVSMNDRSYLQWLISTKTLDDDMQYTLEYYLNNL